MVSGAAPGGTDVKKRNDNDVIDESIDQSFPASDPPSWTAGRAENEPAKAPASVRPAAQEAPRNPTIVEQAARIPSHFFVWGGLAAAATSLGLLIGGRKQAAGFVAITVPSLLLAAVYNEVRRGDRYRTDLH
jgi:hypothetical protein